MCKIISDLNIGTALWLAARGDGWISEESESQAVELDNGRIRYKSEARVLLVGAGADEQCAGPAGYGRHRTKYRNRRYIHMCLHSFLYGCKLIINSLQTQVLLIFCHSWVALDKEMKLDMQRIWKRNLGRDDRCIADKW